jgi:hypothetical protein
MCITHTNQKGRNTPFASSFGSKPFDAGKIWEKPVEFNPRKDWLEPSVSPLQQTKESSKDLIHH